MENLEIDTLQRTCLACIKSACVFNNIHVECREEIVIVMIKIITVTLLYLSSG